MIIGRQEAAVRRTGSCLRHLCVSASSRLDDFSEEHLDKCLGWVDCTLSCEDNDLFVGCGFSRLVRPVVFCKMHQTGLGACWRNPGLPRDNASWKGRDGHLEGRNDRAR